ncbi:unnamed protein product [Moneuplotes crassus]|uniref:Uncharacterized protein n=1 Tax=Euplotes crassus TaxID=5936 RepID=A0AAD1YA41_EUPCR|nr:unnamed protein product [Moneuplotes crassus]
MLENSEEDLNITGKNITYPKFTTSYGFFSQNPVKPSKESNPPKLMVLRSKSIMKEQISKAKSAIIYKKFKRENGIGKLNGIYPKMVAEEPLRDFEGQEVIMLQYDEKKSLKNTSDINPSFSRYKKRNTRNNNFRSRQFLTSSSVDYSQDRFPVDLKILGKSTQHSEYLKKMRKICKFRMEATSFNFNYHKIFQSADQAGKNDSSGLNYKNSMNKREDFSCNSRLNIIEMQNSTKRMRNSSQMYNPEVSLTNPLFIAQKAKMFIRDDSKKNVKIGRDTPIISDESQSDDDDEKEVKFCLKSDRSNSDSLRNTDSVCNKGLINLKLNIKRRNKFVPVYKKTKAGQQYGNFVQKPKPFRNNKNVFEASRKSKSMDPKLCQISCIQTLQNKTFVKENKLNKRKVFTKNIQLNQSPRNKVLRRISSYLRKKLGRSSIER